jgi:hypothetical protein
MNKLKKGGDSSGVDVTDNTITEISNVKDNENVLIPPEETKSTNRKSKKQSNRNNKSYDKKSRKPQKAFSWLSWLFS